MPTTGFPQYFLQGSDPDVLALEVQQAQLRGDFDAAPFSVRGWHGSSRAGSE